MHLIMIEMCHAVDPDYVPREREVRLAVNTSLYQQRLAQSQSAPTPQDQGRPPRANLVVVTGQPHWSVLGSDLIVGTLQAQNPQKSCKSSLKHLSPAHVASSVPITQPIACTVSTKTAFTAVSSSMARHPSNMCYAGYLPRQTQAGTS